VAKKGLFQRLHDWLFGTKDEIESQSAGSAAPTSKLVEYEPADSTEPIVVSAKGDVFHLHLIPHFRWSTDQLTFSELEQRSAKYKDVARSELLHRVWSTARRFDPDDTDAAEKAINQVLEAGWCYEDEAVTLRCKASARVVLDPELRDHKLPIEKKRLNLKADYDLGTLKAELVESLAGRWLAAFQSLEMLPQLGPDERQFLLPYAASLTDEGFAKVMLALAGHRRQLGRELADVLQQASRDHERVGLYEFANAYDKALRTFCRQMGIDPFSWAQSNLDGTDDTAVNA